MGNLQGTIDRRSMALWATAATAATAAYTAWIWAASFTVDGARYWTLRDDALISMTYARTFAEGHGLVWHPDAERVEGYTNLGWTLWMAVVHAAGATARFAPLVVLVSGACLLILCGWLSAQLAQRLGFGRVGSTVAAVLVLAYYPLVYWTLTGMEVGLLAAAALACCVNADRVREGADRTSMLLLCGALAIGVITRTDFLIPAAIVCCWLAWQRGPWLRPAVVTAATLLAHTAFRLVYYGDPLPNTYYLKMTGVPLAQRISEGAYAGAQLAPQLLIVVLAAGFGWWATRRRPLWGLLAAVWAGQVMYSVWVGGDAWEGYGFPNRYIAVGMPAILVLAAGAAARITNRGARPSLAGACVAVVVLAGSVGGTLARWLPEVGPTVTDFEQERYALELADSVPPGTTVAVTWAGAIPYFSRAHGVDLLGKMDRTVAHQPIEGTTSWLPPGHRKWDYEHSIRDVRPDVVPWLWVEADEACGRLSGWGYRPVGNGAWVRQHVDLEHMPEAIPEANTC